MHQPLHEENVLAFDVRFVAEEDLHHVIGSAGLRAAVPRLDELAHYGHIHSPYQVGQKDEGVLQDGQHLDCLTLVVLRDLMPKLLHTLLNLFGRDDWSQRFGSHTHV